MMSELAADGNDSTTTSITATSGNRRLLEIGDVTYLYQDDRNVITEETTNGTQIELTNNENIATNDVANVDLRSRSVDHHEHDATNLILNHDSKVSQKDTNAEVEIVIRNNDNNENAILLQTLPETGLNANSNDASGLDDDDTGDIHNNNDDDSNKIVKKAHTKKCRQPYTVLQKIDLVLEGKETSIRTVSRKYNIDPSILRYWKRNLNALWEKAKIKPNAKTTAPGNFVCGHIQNSGKQKRRDHKQKQRDTFTIQEKINIVLEANETKYYRGTAAKYKINFDQLRYWRRQLPLLLEKAKYNPESKTLHQQSKPKERTIIFDHIWDNDGKFDHTDKDEASNRIDDVSSCHSDDDDVTDDSDEIIRHENILSKYDDDGSDSSDDESYHLSEDGESSDESLDESTSDMKEFYCIKEAKDGNFSDYSDSLQREMKKKRRTKITNYDRENMPPTRDLDIQVRNDSDSLDPPRRLKKIHKKHQFRYTVKQKIDIVMEAIECKNFRATARKYNVENRSVHDWMKNLVSLQEKALINPKALSWHNGMKRKNSNVEEKIIHWITEKINNGVCISTNHILQKALELEPLFFNGNDKRQQRWIYNFIKRANIVIK